MQRTGAARGETSDQHEGDHGRHHAAQAQAGHGEGGYPECQMEAG